MFRKAFKYRLYPTKQQEHHLLFVLRRCRELYNSALEQRKVFYQMRRTSLCYAHQAAELAEIKVAYPAYQDIYAQVLQDVLRRLDKAFAAFFRRLRNGEKPGYPRFKGQGRYDSFTYPQGGFALAGNRLTLSKIGDLKVRHLLTIGCQKKSIRDQCQKSQREISKLCQCSRRATINFTASLTRRQPMSCAARSC